MRRRGVPPDEVLASDKSDRAPLECNGSNPRERLRLESLEVDQQIDPVTMLIHDFEQGRGIEIATNQLSLESGIQPF